MADMRIHKSSMRCAIAVIACFCVAVMSSAVGQAQQRTAAQSVYSAAQATRGQQLYEAQCVMCHGEQLQGVVGPMLAGDLFLTSWGGRPVADLVDKIQKTMPFQQPGTLSRPQSIDITAYILQAGMFPAGNADLAETALAAVTFPGQPAAPAAAAGTLPLAATANLAQLMRGITFPNANIIFNTQLRNPGEEKPKAPVPFDYRLWGNTVYYGWQAIDQAALALRETTPLFLLPGRRCENGKPVPINKADFQQYTKALIDLSGELYKAAQTRNVDNVSAMSEQLNNSCANCHKVYRDVGTSEGGGLGTDRCKQ